MDRNDAVFAAEAALRAGEPKGMNGLVVLALGIAVPAVLGMAVLVITVLTRDVGLAVGVVLGAFALCVGVAIGLRRLRAAMSGPRPGTLAWEAQLTLDPLAKRLDERLTTLDAHPSRQAIAELMFYTAQLLHVRELARLARHVPGRGYVGFDTFGSPANSWPR